MVNKKWILLFCLVFLLSNSCGDGIASAGDKALTREEIKEKLVLAAHGNYYWVIDGSEQKPFMPKGFPQWNSSKGDVRKIMGSPSQELTIYNLATDKYTFKYHNYESNNYLIYKNDKLVAIGFGGIYYTGRVRDKYLSICKFWSSVSDPGDPADCYFSDFALYSDSNRTIRIASWEGKEGANGEADSFVGLRDFARDLGITKK